MIELIDIESVKKSLPLKDNGIKNYIYIMNLLHQCNVSKNEDFKKKYNGFYRLRLPSSNYYDFYYEYMEKNKYNTSLTFEDVVTTLSKTTGRIEASFSSKLLATINPDLPVWDANVLSNINIKAPKYNDKDKLDKTIKTYYNLKNWYKSYMQTKNAADIINLFDNIYPDYKITNIKKIDLALWSLGKSK